MFIHQIIVKITSFLFIKNSFDSNVPIFLQRWLKKVYLSLQPFYRFLILYTYMFLSLPLIHSLCFYLSIPHSLSVFICFIFISIALFLSLYFFVSIYLLIFLGMSLSMTFYFSFYISLPIYFHYTCSLSLPLSLSLLSNLIYFLFTMPLLFSKREKEINPIHCVPRTLSI